MTREEQIKQAAEQYAWVGNLYDLQSAFTAGAKWADNTMIERVRKWLYTIDFDSQSFRDCDETFDNDLFIDTICKVMEE